MAGYGTWDARQEKFRPLRADAALDHVVAQGGPIASLVLFDSML
jgi:hypothetical protein